MIVFDTLVCTEKDERHLDHCGAESSGVQPKTLLRHRSAGERKRAAHELIQEFGTAVMAGKKKLKTAHAHELSWLKRSF